MQNKPPAIFLKLGDSIINHQLAMLTLAFPIQPPQRIHVLRILCKIDQEIRSKCVEFKKVGKIHQVATYEAGISVKVSSLSSSLLISSLAALSVRPSNKRRLSSPAVSTQPCKLSTEMFILCKYPV